MQLFLYKFESSTFWKYFIYTDIQLLHNSRTEINIASLALFNPKQTQKQNTQKTQTKHHHYLSQNCAYMHSRKQKPAVS